MSKKIINARNPYLGKNDYYPNTPFQLNYIDETDEEWEKYRNQLLETINKSQDDFENRITLLSSGGLIIALTLLDKLFEYKIIVELKYLIVGSIIMFVSSLIANFYSHHIAIKNNEKNIEDIDTINPNIITNIIRRNRYIRWLNNTSSITITLGAITLFLFFILNFINMNNNKQISTPKPSTEKPASGSGNLEKGRTTQTPPAAVKPKK